MFEIAIYVGVHSSAVMLILFLVQIKGEQTVNFEVFVKTTNPSLYRSQLKQVP